MSSQDVVWITVDSLRFDHTSLSGYDRDTTPGLAKWADRDDVTNFTNGFAHGKNSRVSVSSMFTGVHPEYHGNGFQNSVIPEEITTIAERFRDAGYWTEGIVSNPHITKDSNADRGFNEYQWYNKRELLSPSNIVDTARYLLNIHRHSAGLVVDPSVHSIDYYLSERIRSRVSKLSQQDAPNYLYCHFQGVHHPYYPPRPYQKMFTNDITMEPDQALKAAREISCNTDRYIANGLDFSEIEYEALIAMYDALVAYSDSLVMPLVEYLEDKLSDPIIIVTADHGDQLGERGMLTHSLTLHDALLHVPLVVRGLDDVGPADQLVQHIDIIQTILEKIGAETEGMHGLDLHSETRKYVFSQREKSSFEDNMRNYQQYNPNWDPSPYHRERTDCLRSKSFKLVDSDDMTRLYKLPDESTDVKDSYPDVLTELREALNEFRQSIPDTIDAEQEEKLSKGRREQLRDLGYID